MSCITMTSTQKWKEHCFSPFLHDDIGRIKQANSVTLEFPYGWLWNLLISLQSKSVLLDVYISVCTIEQAGAPDFPSHGSRYA